MEDLFRVIREQKIMGYKKRIKHKFDSRFFHLRASEFHRWRFADFLFFDDVIVKGVENIRYIEDKQLFYVSNHTSLADFLIQGYIFWRDKLPMPRFIAGENLNKGPFGYLWKRCGAISVDRNMSRKNTLYWSIYDACVKEPLLNGENLLNYGEGTRTDGKEIGRFKTGTFGQIIDVVEQGKDAWAVPIYIAYDKRVEDPFIDKAREYRVKRDEAIKQERYIKARVFDWGYFLCDLSSFLIRPFIKDKGNTYIYFGEGFSLKDFLRENTEGWGSKKLALTNKVRDKIVSLENLYKASKSD